MVLRLVLAFLPHSLNGKDGILGTAVAFLANAGFFAPEVAIDSIALGHFVVAIALREIHAAAIGEFPQQSQHLPFGVVRGPLGWIAEEDLVLDLQTTQL